MPKVRKLSDWEFHLQSCAKCGGVDIEETSTMAQCCYIGALYLRDFLAKKASASRPREMRDPDEKRLTQYIVRERYTVTEVDKKTEKPVTVEKQKTISPVYTRPETAHEFLSLAMKTMGGNPSRFFISQK